MEGGIRRPPPQGRGCNGYPDSLQAAGSLYRADMPARYGRGCSAGISPSTGLAPREVVHAGGNRGVGELRH